MKTIFAAVGGTRHGMEATLHIHLQDLSNEFAWRVRPMIIVCPGGAYLGTSDREADPVAMQFLAMGYNAAVLRYSCAPAKYPDALIQLGRAHLYLRRHAKEFKIDPNAIYTIGFSAGGHLVCNYCERWTEDFVRQQLEYDIEHSMVREDKHIDVEELRPNGMMLGYPVISSGEYAHKGSFENLIGTKEDFASEEEYQKMLEEVSLEKHVNKNVPPAFIWGTAEDGSVHPMNSVLLVEALMRENIPVEYHLFRQGGHGLSLGDERTVSTFSENNASENNVDSYSNVKAGKEYVPSISAWVSMAETWIRGLH